MFFEVSMSQSAEGGGTKQRNKKPEVNKTNKTKTKQTKQNETNKIHNVLYGRGGG